MSKKIFIVTGEPSGDRLASKVISRLKKINNNIEFLSVGGTYLKLVGVDSIFDLKNITYLQNQNFSFYFKKYNISLCLSLFFFLS